MREFLKKYIRPIAKVLGMRHIAYAFLMKMIYAQYAIANRHSLYFEKTARILTYHRISTVTHDPHLLCVTPEHFEEQLRWLVQNYTIVSLLELQDRIVNKSLIGNEVVITFDDGYQDNLTQALPILEKYNAPATIFVTTGWLGKVASQPWDLEYEETDRAKFLNKEEIVALAQNPLITIGAHTHTHNRLSNLSEPEQALEIETCKKKLEEVCKHTISVFAYPFGGPFDFSDTTKELVESNGFALACATIPRLTTNTSSLFALPRINIRNYSTKVLATQLLYQD